MSVYAGPEFADLVRGEVDRLMAGEYSIEAEPPIIKRFACCHAAHTCIEGILELRPRLIGQLDSIREIVAETSEDGGIFLIHERPTTGMEAKFSMQGALAAALVLGRAGADVFVDETFQREDVRALMPKVRMEVTDRPDGVTGSKGARETACVRHAARGSGIGGVRAHSARVACRKGTISRMSSMSHPYTVLPTRKSSVRRAPVDGARRAFGSEVETVEAKVLQRIEVASECVVGKTSLCSGGQRSAEILRQR